MPASKLVDEDGKIGVFRLKVPLALALGRYELLTKRQLEEHVDDIRAEVRRRNGK